MLTALLQINACHQRVPGLRSRRTFTTALIRRSLPTILAREYRAQQAQQDSSPLIAQRARNAQAAFDGAIRRLPIFSEHFLQDIAALGNHRLSTLMLCAPLSLSCTPALAPLTTHSSHYVYETDADFSASVAASQALHFSESRALRLPRAIASFEVHCLVCIYFMRFALSSLISDQTLADTTVLLFSDRWPLDALHAVHGADDFGGGVRWCTAGRRGFAACARASSCCLAGQDRACWDKPPRVRPPVL